MIKKSKPNLDVFDRIVGRLNDLYESQQAVAEALGLFRDDLVKLNKRIDLLVGNSAVTANVSAGIKVDILNSLKGKNDILHDSSVRLEQKVDNLIQQTSSFLDKNKGIKTENFNINNSLVGQHQRIMGIESREVAVDKRLTDIEYRLTPWWKRKKRCPKRLNP